MSNAEDDAQIASEEWEIEAILQRWWKSGDDRLMNRAMPLFELLKGKPPPPKRDYQVELRVRVFVPDVVGSEKAASDQARELVASAGPSVVVDEVIWVQAVD